MHVPDESGTTDRMNSVFRTDADLSGNKLKPWRDERVLTPYYHQDTISH
jgi:hypothetical protein